MYAFLTTIESLVKYFLLWVGDALKPIILFVDIVSALPSIGIVTMLQELDLTSYIPFDENGVIANLPFYWESQPMAKKIYEYIV